MRGGLNYLLSVVWIEVSLESDLGPAKGKSGTAFCVRGRDGHVYLVTNKHVVHSLGLGGEGFEHYTRARLTAHFRRFDGNGALPDTAPVPLPADSWRLTHHKSSAVSIYDTHHAVLPAGFAAVAFQEEDLADQQFHERLQPMDFVSFIGFPRGLKGPWIDEVWNTPIARQASISSMPGVPYANSAMSTTDVTLVNGLSFEGSSGSPVVCHPRDEAAIGIGLPHKLVGVMSGGWRADPFDQDRHSGISYYTRSTSILELLRGAAHSA